MASLNFLFLPLQSYTKAEILLITMPRNHDVPFKSKSYKCLDRILKINLGKIVLICPNVQELNTRQHVLNGFVIKVTWLDRIDMKHIYS